MYGTAWADNYLRFLKRGIDELATTSELGRPVGNRADPKYRLLRRRSRGHGHVVVYRIVDNIVRVLHVFHTAQNWHETNFDG
jgi:plasmid stabilization system protein ParE